MWMKILYFPIILILQKIMELLVGMRMGILDQIIQ